MATHFDPTPLFPIAQFPGSSLWILRIGRKRPGRPPRDVTRQQRIRSILGMPVVRFEFYKDLGRERLGRGKPLFRERRGFLDENNSQTLSLAPPALLFLLTNFQKVGPTRDGRLLGY